MHLLRNTDDNKNVNIDEEPRVSPPKGVDDKEKMTLRDDHDNELVLPTASNPDPHDIYIDQVKRRQKLLRGIISFTHSSTKAAAIMVIAAVVALIVANTGAYDSFIEFWHMKFSIGLGPLEGSMSLAHIINDVFMAIFFLLVGLEIKYEMTAGELTNIRQAILPILAAAGGVLAPIGIYLIFNATHPEAAWGWGVPTATDIAFALGIMALLGDKVPNGVRVFLSTLAVADDIIAIIVIAVFYGETPDFMWLLISLGIFLVMLGLNRMHVYSLVPYIFLGILLWVGVYFSGIHSTISGVLIAFAIPSGSNIKLQSFLNWSDDRVKWANTFYDGDNTPLVAQKKYIYTMSSLTRMSKQAVPPATRLETKLYPWVYFLILPLFALTNADVSMEGIGIQDMLSSTVVMGVFFGLLLGKPIGIMLFSFLTIKLRIAKLPENVNWLHMFGAAILGGVGFTMAIFVANLAYTDEVLITEAKIAILSASVLAAVIGFLFLYIEANREKKKGVSYVSNYKDNENLTHDKAEFAKNSGRVIEALEEEDRQEHMKKVESDTTGMSELKIERKKKD